MPFEGWYLDSTRMYVTDFSDQWKQIIARLQPISGPTVHQIFGYESPIYKLKAVIVGDTDRIALFESSRDASLHTISGYVGAPIVFNAYVEDLAFTLRQGICQTLRSDLADDAPVYDVDITVLFDE